MKAILVLSFCLLTLTATAKETGAHVHGAASLQVVVDGASLIFNFESPLDNLIGFERGPRSDAERAKVRAMAQRFHNGADLFVPTPEARCTLRDVQLTSAVIAPGLLAAIADPAATNKPADAAAAQAGGHADLDASLRFECEQPAALRGVDVRLFRAFGGLRQIDAAVAGPRTQRGGRLTPQRTLLSW